ncbi:MAG: divalent-cation tolerance protein CutA [Oxalobacteraceae bacterium]|jgi:periplasmic divalent cation tolerance protein|nr:divalent-cation tolerance protein CutA [Oxalobacteraceae bacterium]
MEPVFIVMTHMPDTATAEALAGALVEARLAACASVAANVQSVYRWQGKIERANEVTLTIKTTQRHYAALEAAIRAAHPYELPEIIALPVVAGLSSYLQWVATETSPDHHA